jgi:hypothetical protein
MFIVDRNDAPATSNVHPVKGRAGVSGHKGSRAFPDAVHGIGCGFCPREGRGLPGQSLHAADIALLLAKRAHCGGKPPLHLSITHNSDLCVKIFC